MALKMLIIAGHNGQCGCRVMVSQLILTLLVFLSLILQGGVKRKIKWDVTVFSVWPFLTGSCTRGCSKFHSTVKMYGGIVGQRCSHFFIRCVAFARLLDLWHICIVRPSILPSLLCSASQHMNNTFCYELRGSRHHRILLSARWLSPQAAPFNKKQVVWPFSKAAHH